MCVCPLFYGTWLQHSQVETSLQISGKVNHANQPPQLHISCCIVKQETASVQMYKQRTLCLRPKWHHITYVNKLQYERTNYNVNVQTDTSIIRIGLNLRECISDQLTYPTAGTNVATELASTLLPAMKDQTS